MKKQILLINGELAKIREYKRVN